MPIKTDQLELSNWMGLDRFSPETEVDPHYFTDLQNVEFEQGGMVSKRRGTIALSTTFSGTIDFLYDFQSQQGFTSATDRQRVLVVSGGTLYVVNNFLTAPTIDASFSAVNEKHYAVSTPNGICVISNEGGGIPSILAYVNGAWVYRSLALDGPALAATLSAVGGATLDGTFQGAYAYVDVWGNESPRSPDSDEIFLSSQGLDMSVIASTDTTVDYIVAYILGPGMSEFQLSGTMDNSTGTYSHTITMATLLAGAMAPRNMRPAPSGKYVTMYEDMLLVGGDMTIPDTVWASENQFYREWHDTYTRCQSGDGQPVVGFGKSFGRTVVLKSDSVHMLEGTSNDDFRSRDYVYRYGAVGQPAVAYAGDQMVFFSDDGMYVDTGSSPDEVSKIIREYLKTLDFRCIIPYQGRPRLNLSTYKYYRQVYMTAREDIPAGFVDEPDTLLIWSYGRNAWTRWNGCAPRILATIQNPDDYEYLYGAWADGTIAWFTPLQGAYLDDNLGATTAIDAYVETPWMNFAKLKGVPDWERTRHIPRFLELYVSGQCSIPDQDEISLQLEYWVDLNRDNCIGTFTMTFTAHDWPTIRPYKQTLYYGGTIGTFRWIKWRFSNANEGEHFKIHKQVYGFKMKPAVD